MQDQQEQALARLREMIEEAVGRKMKTPKDFDFLADQIFDKLHETVSSTTLKRMWGYLQESSSPRESTLDILAQFVDYKDWETFCSEASAQEEAAPVSLWQRFKDWGIFVPLVFSFIVLPIWGLLSQPSKHQDPRELLDNYILKQYTHFDNPEDYMDLLGIHDINFFWGRQIPSYPGIFIWGPEYGNPTWGNKGDSAAMMPTITVHWTSENVDSPTIKQRNSDFYNLFLHRNEIRITFMKNLVDTGYIYLGIYRLSKELSDSTQRTWERVQGDFSVHDLDELYKYCN